MTAADEADALWKAILAEPGDHGAKRAFADWLEERGRDPEFAFALRWAAAHRRYPSVSPGKRSILWRVAGAEGGAILPRLVFQQLRPTSRRYGVYRSATVADAFRALAHALQRLRDAVAIPQGGEP